MLLALQGPANTVGCKRNDFPAGITSVGEAFAPHTASHALRNAFHIHIFSQLQIS